MARSRFYNKKKGNIILLALMLLMVTVAYATLKTDLTINGTTKVKNPTWNIIWQNPRVTEGSIINTLPTVSNLSTTATYSVELDKPGDYYEFTIEAKNTGTIDAMVDTISNKTYELDGTTPKEIPIYVTYRLTYSDGTAIQKNHKLAAGAAEVYKVRVEFTKDITAAQLPQNIDDFQFKFEVNYVQADNNAIVRS